MTAQDIETLLRQTLDDRKLTRGERKVLSSYLDDIDADANNLAALRAKTFDIARETLNNPEAREVLEWVEDVVKALIPKAMNTPSGMAEAFFSPGEDCLNRIKGLIDGCRSSADICVFTITDNRLADSIISAKNRGVAVRVITDNDKSMDRGSDIMRLDEAGVPVRIDRTDKHMHHKFAVFDKRIVLTGSYNWTRSAALYNEENITVLDHQKLVKAFLHEFEKLWEAFGG